MGKYIDADRLRAEIERRIHEISHPLKDGYEVQSIGKIEGLSELLEIIDSLQQEQPEVDLVAELKHHVATTPKEQLEKEWKELEPWNNIGPTVQEFLYGKQPEVNLENEIDLEWKKCDPIDEGMGLESANMVNEQFDHIARHFYNLGLNARKV